MTNTANSRSSIGSTSYHNFVVWHEKYFEIAVKDYNAIYKYL